MSKRFCVAVVLVGLAMTSGPYAMAQSGAKISGKLIVEGVNVAAQTTLIRFSGETIAHGSKVNSQ
jgi:hypothetical protein